MVAVSSAPIGTSRLITSVTSTSGTTGGGALFCVHAASIAATAPVSSGKHDLKAKRLFGGVTGCLLKLVRLVTRTVSRQGIHRHWPECLLLKTPAAGAAWAQGPISPLPPA